MKVYLGTVSGNSYKVKILLALLKAPHEVVIVDLKNKEHKGAAFLKINPRGEVPALEDNGKVFWDSAACLAYIARKLDTIQEGERTLLDNSMLMFCSSMLTGNHDATQLPVVLLGGAGGRLQGGRVLDYKEKPDRQMCRLFLSMMDKMDVRLERFGDASRPLEEV